MTGVADGRNVCLQHLSVQESGLLHAPLAENSAQLNESINIVGGVEKWEALAEERQEDDTAAPVVDQACLPSTFEKDLWGAEATRAGSVCTAR